MKTMKVNEEKNAFSQTSESPRPAHQALSRVAAPTVRCDRCCWKDRCDKPEHFHRESCPYCKGTGRVSAPKVDEWRPIETAPKDSNWILGLVRTGRQTVVRWGGGAWEDDNRLCRDPTHWMPLPNPPQPEGDDKEK